ncbi:MAG TPA: FtsX-like permease family protein [Flavitalea sp.]|nr:FtsX-like permease family protein [Flavitalea sp.]
MMNRLRIEVARSLLLARWRQTLVAAIGVTFSITMFVALLSFMTGLNTLMDDLFLNRAPHIRLYNEIEQNVHQPITFFPRYRNHYHFISSVKATSSREELYNSAAILRSLKSDSRVKGIAPKISTPVFFNEGNVSISGMINGIDVVEESKLFHFYEYITVGSGEDLRIVPNSVILGKVLAEKLLVKVGDIVYVTTSKGQTFPLKLVGLYESGIRDYDKTTAFTSISTAQKILGKTSRYLTEMHLKLHDINNAPKLAREYSSLFGVKAEDFQSANAEFDTGNFIRSLISYMVGITLLIVSGFGIYNILNMMIYEKMDSIAILKATGFSSLDVRVIFLLIALSIGVFGGTGGLIFGYFVSLAVDAIPFHVSSLPSVETYPINYNPMFYVIGITFSIIATYLAALFPAAKAARVDPVIIIRGK